jgi:hypothetical protein
VYTAASTLQVGKVNPNSPGFYGFVQSASDLATAFSRAIGAAPVLATVGTRLGLSPTQAVARLSAEPIPNSPAFRVIAAGSTPRKAVDLANVTSEALVAYEAQTNSYSRESERLLGAYRAASLNLVHATAQVSRARRSYAKHRDEARRSRIERAEASRAAAALRADGVASGYRLTAQSVTTGELVSVLASATTATGNRKSRIELLGFVGLLGGLVIGTGLAVLLDQRRGSRHPPQASGNG